MNIKKTLKKEEFNRKRNIIISILVMIIMAYLVTVLTNNQVLTGFDSYFSFFYVIVVDFLLLINITSVISEEKISFNINEDKLRIDGGYLGTRYVLPLNKIVYVDVHTIDQKDFNVIIITKKAHRKKYKDINPYFIKKNPHYNSTFDYIKENYGEDERFSYIEIKKSGSRKYYLLFVLYKTTYNIGFSKNAIEYIKRFTKEYNL
ncbi:MAG: hypothetical protein RR645_00230 [Clostridium sp.]